MVTGRRRGISIAIAIALVLGACGSETDPVSAATEIATSEAEFGTALEAGQSLARIAEHLNVAYADCDAAERGTQCSALSAASGFAQVLAVVVLKCTAPGRFEARTAIAEYLVTIEGVAAMDGRVPEPPPIPKCG